MLKFGGRKGHYVIGRVHRSRTWASASLACALERDANATT
jgi:hypothetical protein